MTERVLDRTYGIANNIDPRGKKWVIQRDAGEQSMYVVGHENEDGTISNPRSVPPNMSGRWTSKERLAREIAFYVQASWDESDRIKEKSTRKQNREEVSGEAA